jgi:hypothetical protein
MVEVEFNKKINIAVRSEIAVEQGTEKRQTTDVISLAEFSDFFFRQFNPSFIHSLPHSPFYQRPEAIIKWIM